MKNILITLLTIITLISCSSDDNTKTVVLIKDNPILVLNKNRYHYGRGLAQHKLYVFDGTKSYWADVDFDLFKKYNAGDTLKNATLSVYVETVKDNNCNEK